MDGGGYGGYPGMHPGMAQHHGLARIGSMGGPGAQGPRRNKVKQRGREDVGGLAAPSRQRAQPPAERFARVRVRLRGQRPFERGSARSGEKKSHKKRN